GRAVRAWPALAFRPSLPGSTLRRGWSAGRPLALRDRRVRQPGPGHRSRRRARPRDLALGRSNPHPRRHGPYALGHRVGQEAPCLRRLRTARGAVPAGGEGLLLVRHRTPLLERTPALPARALRADDATVERPAARGRRIHGGSPHTLRPALQPGGRAGPPHGERLARG